MDEYVDSNRYHLTTPIGKRTVYGSTLNRLVGEFEQDNRNRVTLERMLVTSPNENGNATLRILSYNIKALFPYYTSSHGEDIIRYIEQLFVHRKIDIVCLQEAFALDFYDKLYELIDRLGLNLSHPPLEGKFLVGVNSGLVVISRFRIVEDTFLSYERSSGLDLLSNKGAQYLTMEINRKLFNIVNTHLQSDNEKLAMEQFEQLINNLTSRSAIIVGDMNMGFDTINNLEIVRCVNSERVVTFPKLDEQLDYFLLYNLGIQESDCSLKALSDVNLSDHYPIMITIIR